VTDLVMKILRTPPAPISAVNPLVQPALEQAVLRALAKAPADRFPSMRQLAAGLPRPV